MATVAQARVPASVLPPGTVRDTGAGQDAGRGDRVILSWFVACQPTVRRAARAPVVSGDKFVRRIAAASREPSLALVYGWLKMYTPAGPGWLLGGHVLHAAEGGSGLAPSLCVRETSRLTLSHVRCRASMRVRTSLTGCGPGLRLVRRRHCRSAAAPCRDGGCEVVVGNTCLAMPDLTRRL